MADPIADLLRKAPMTDAQRADAWDAFYQASDQADLTAKLQTMKIPDAAKAALWDRKAAMSKPSTSGPLTPGNIDLFAQPVVKNPDGTTSTVDSSSYNIDGKEVLLPSVTPDGRHLKTADEILAEYDKTGRHLGIFADPDSATAYARQLHDDYAAGKYTRQPARTWTDTAVDALPTIGGLAGGIIGGIGGTVAGMGVGGVPGAVGGATVGGAAGESARQLVNRARGAPAPNSPIQAATSIATQGALQGGAELIGGAVTKGATKAASAVYRGYLKPSLSNQMLPRANAIVKTALDEALPISRGGVETANRVIGELRAEVEDVLAKAAGKVDLHQIANKVRSFARSRYYKPGVDSTDFDAAMAVANKLDAHPALNLPPGAAPTRVDVSLSKANEVKRALDTSVKETGFGVTTGAKKSTEKFARHEINTELQQKAAKIAPLNARESKLIDAAKTIARAVEREANQNQVYGVKSLVAGMGGASAYGSGQSPENSAAVALALRAGFHPAIASRAAIVSHRLAKELGVTMAQATRLSVYALLPDQAEQEQ